MKDLFVVQVSAVSKRILRFGQVIIVAVIAPALPVCLANRAGDSVDRIPAEPDHGPGIVGHFNEIDIRNRFPGRKGIADQLLVDGIEML